jgi:hypothetical protein
MQTAPICPLSLLKFFLCHGFSRRRASNGVWLRPPLIKGYQFHAYLKGVMAGPVVQYIS